MTQCKIKYFPISFFSIILGLAGFTIATYKLKNFFNILNPISFYSLYFTVGVFLILSFVYLIKIFAFPREVQKEFNNPIKISFFPTFSISMLLLSVAFLEIDKRISLVLWVSGTLIHLLFTLKIISIWMHHDKFEIKHLSPAWFIPAVGNILVPIAGVVLFTKEVSWFFFSIGFFFWIILLIIVFNRIIFHHPLPRKLMPTLFILIAPPAIGFISFVKLTGQVNEFAKILYYFSLFLFILIVSQTKYFYKLKFYLSWWAYSFPISAVTIASILMFHKTNSWFYLVASYVLYGILVFVIIILLIKTFIAILKREICTEEE